MPHVSLAAIPMPMNPEKDRDAMSMIARIAPHRKISSDGMLLAFFRAKSNPLAPDAPVDPFEPGFFWDESGIVQFSPYRCAQGSK